MIAQKYQDACFQVTGWCLDFTSPIYFINEGRADQEDYNITRRISGSRFCLMNVLNYTVVTERCEYIPDNVFCRSSAGVLIFLSRVHVYINNRPLFQSTMSKFY